MSMSLGSVLSATKRRENTLKHGWGRGKEEGGRVES